MRESEDDDDDADDDDEEGKENEEEDTLCNWYGNPIKSLRHGIVAFIQ